ncbi:MAG: Dot/Icm T4SS effector Ceg17 [Legionella sp.]
MKYSTNPLSHIVENADDIPPKTFQFCDDFNNVGALIMRFHFGQSQRSGSLTQVVRSDYKNYAIEKVGDGVDQTDFFDVPVSSSEALRDSLKLHQLSSYPLGEAKILNRLTQAIQERNSMIAGEQWLFGTIHTAVWQPVISLAGHLTKSNFAYIPCPAYLNQTKYQDISLALNEGKFSIDETSKKIEVLDYTFYLTAVSNLKIQPLENDGATFQTNGLLVHLKNSASVPAPLGWMIHVPSKKMLAQADTEDLISLISLAEGKFHQLSPAQQKILMSGRLEDNERVRVTQNRQLNAMLSIFATLETEFDFDPRPLINNVLKKVARATQKSIEETSVLDDFLTGIIQTSMVQHLVVTKKQSARAELPLAFNLDFKTIKNNAKALAYAFNMKDGNGFSVLQNGEKEDAFYQDERLPDLEIKGELLTPSLTDSRHCAAILSTAMLVAEQMILEQLLASIVRNDGNEHYVHALTAILKMCHGGNTEHAEKACEHLLTLAKKCHKSDLIPLLGLQYEHCAELITALRSSIGTDHLIHLASALGTESHSTPEEILKTQPSHSIDAYMNGLNNLHLICAELQRRLKFKNLRPFSSITAHLRMKYTNVRIRLHSLLVLTLMRSKELIMRRSVEVKVLSALH